MLKEDVLKSFEGLKGKVSIVLKDLKNKDLIYELNSERVVPSASTIKILIMIEALNQILLGKHHLDEIICTKQNDRVEYSIISELDGYCYTFKDLITLMIIISDNTATNVLIDLLGFDSINNMALKLGLKETRLRRKMMDFEAAKLGRQNTTTTMDMAILMELLYNSSILDEDMCRLAIDMAIYDLFGKKYNIPLYKFFGGARREIETDITISVNSPEEMAQDAVNYVKEGYSTLKTKVGIDAELDICRVKAIRDAIGYEVKIRLDANQGWAPKEAIRTIRKMEDMNLNIELVEQPVKAHDKEGLKYVTDNVETPIMADESLFSPYDCFELLKYRAVDILNVKLMKCGGLYNAQKINSMAESCGIQCMIGCMIESKVGIAAAAHLAGGKLNITKADLDAIALFEEDPILGGVELSGNKLIIDDKPGLGISGINYKGGVVQ